MVLNAVAREAPLIYDSMLNRPAKISSLAKSVSGAWNVIGVFFDRRFLAWSKRPLYVCSVKSSMMCGAVLDSAWVPMDFARVVTAGK